MKCEEHHLVHGETDRADDQKFLKSLRDEPNANGRLGPALRRHHLFVFASRLRAQETQLARHDPKRPFAQFRETYHGDRRN